MLYFVKGVFYQGGLYMLEEFILELDMLSQGFLNTRATILIDGIISFLGMLPIIIMISILFAKRGYIKIHQSLQVSLLLMTISALALFAYSVHYVEGFESLIQQGSSMGVREAFILLTIHITTVVITLLIWSLTIFYAYSDVKRRALPGLYSETHRRAGRRVLLGILLISLTSISIYWILYMA